MAQMTRRERLAATVAGEPVDRIAVALWRHFPGDDQRPADLAAATLMWQQTVGLGLHQGLAGEQFLPGRLGRGGSLGRRR